MKFGTGIGIVLSMIGIAVGATMEGTNVMVVLNIPAISIVLIGTLGATIAACGLEAHIKLPMIYKKARIPDELVRQLMGAIQQHGNVPNLLLDEVDESKGTG